jgi:NAD(P)-dependent dehydrogenase (short-subunit alcohol dehydrogenase family)
LSLDGRRILITGAGRGLGAAVAEACAAAGGELILLGRTRGSLEAIDDKVRQAGGRAATLVPLDLAQGGEHLDKLGHALFERYGRLDGLVGCAAELGQLTPVSHLAPAELARVMAVNTFANQRLIRTLEPLLRASDAGRAVFVTDRVARDATAYWGAYAASKAALETLVLAWAKELAPTPIRAVLVDPGPMATRLRAKAFPGEAADRQPDSAQRAPAIVSLLDPASIRTAEIIDLAGFASGS